MADIASVFGRHEFLIRRLHSLTGLIPVGAFLVVHLLTNAAILDTADTYQDRVNLIHWPGAYTLQVVEWLFIFLPILFHGIIGMIIVARGKRNVSIYTYRENLRYTLQRWTGVIAFAFIFWHVFQTRGWINYSWWLEHVTKPLGGGMFQWEHHQAARSSAAAVQEAAPWVAILYAIGVLSAVYHFANGLWTMGITWGVWTGPRAQRWASLFCLGIGLVLAGFGLATIYGFSVFPLSPSSPG